jgi:transcriptional regulator with GAF, ATPase, and Fis domain
MSREDVRIRAGQARALIRLWGSQIYVQDRTSRHSLLDSLHVSGSERCIMTAESANTKRPLPRWASWELAAFAELSKIMLGNDALDHTLGRIAALACEAIGDITEVSVTMVDGDKATTVVFTGQLAANLDERQYENGFGPCLDAAITGQTIVVDLDADNPYRDFSSAGRRAGVTHTVSVGLPVPQRTVGALNLYASTPQPLADRTIERAQVFASYAGVAVANAALGNHTADLADQMRAARQSRSVIEQAKGILMQRLGCDADDAFSYLSKLCQRSNRKLPDIAQWLVENPGLG